MSEKFISRFADDLDGMIELRVSLGAAESTYMSRAVSFDRYAAENYPLETNLTEPLVLGWIKPDIENPSKSAHYKAAFARTFGKYLDSIGKPAYIISDTYMAGKSIFMPYIFSDKELAGIFHEIDIYKNPKKPFEEILLSTYFRLMYTCGLRPNEGRNIKRNDVDLDLGEIRILNTKWHKSRTVVMSDDMKVLARNYTNIRDAAFPESEYFFPNPGGGPYTATWFGGKFRKFFALSQPDVPQELLPSIRVYDLRHRFATAVLNRWLDQKVDISSRLPYLQTYMGHKEISATAYYIHLLPENLVKSAGVDWASMNSMIPEVELWGK